MSRLGPAPAGVYSDDGARLEGLMAPNGQEIYLSPTSPSGLYNVIKSNYVNLSNSIKQTLNNQKRTRIFYFGDSTSAGLNPLTGWTNAYQVSVPTQIAQALKAQVCNAGYQSHYGPAVDVYSGGTNWVFYGGSHTDQRITDYGGSWGQFIVGQAFCDRFALSNVATDSITFTPNIAGNAGIPTNTIDFSYLDLAGYDPFTIYVNGTLKATASIVGNNTTKKVTATSGTIASIGNVYKMQKTTTGTTLILGYEAYDSNNAEISLINCSLGSTVLSTQTVNSFTYHGYVYPPTPNTWYMGLNPILNGVNSSNPSSIIPDAVVISYGINFWDNLNDLPATLFQTQLDSVVAAFLNVYGVTGNTSVPVVLITPPPSPVANASVSVQQAYIAVFYLISQKYGIALIDAWGNMGGTNVQAVANSWMSPSDVHPYPVGYGIIAGLFVNFIKMIL